MTAALAVHGQTHSVLVFYFLLLFLSQYFLRKLFFLGNFSVLEYFYDKFLKSEYNDFKEAKSGEILSKLTSDSIKISDWYSQGKVILVTQSFILFSILIFMCRYNVMITLILFSVILVCFFIIKQISKKLSNCMKSEQKLLGETNQYIAKTNNNGAVAPSKPMKAPSSKKGPRI